LATTKTPMGNSKTQSGSRVCAHCEGELPNGHGNRKYCSGRCRRDAWELTQRGPCPDCGDVEISYKSSRCVECQRLLQRTDGNRSLSYLSHLWKRGLPAAEIAEIMGCAPASVYVRVANARRAGIEGFPHRYNVVTETRRGAKPRTDPTHDTIRARTKAAIRDGLLTRPDACEWCGKECHLDAHHLSYDKPDSHLDVEWICPSCHAHHHQPKHKQTKEAV
jgi:hypothetical protein